MASGAVWGIDIGQCALKALRCRAQPESDSILAEAFDYIEYPKILSQPGADPVELVDAAVKQFLSRNSVAGDRVAISVGGQTGLVRFIKLPPVEARKISAIVRYEARQQIPFDLNDVVWDYQRMGGGSEEEGFALEAEIGLFALKRDAVFRAVEPLRKANVEVDVVQLMPLALYNFVLFDQMPALPPIEEYDLDQPPESVVILSLGTDATDLVITNGYRVWQRSVPLGGNHFTKALTKDLKLTFAKAEHLKRNATAAADPKAVFQAMRPVFGELLTELQRSISYFCNLDRTARIGRIVALGNAMKLPGLRRYLAQSLGYEIDRVDSFRKLAGSLVVSAPAFEENLSSFGACYGLAIQALGKAGVHTNLLPKEIIRDRLIRTKKPWAIAAAAALLLSCTLSFAAYAFGLDTVTRPDWQSALAEAKKMSEQVTRLKTDAQKALDDLNSIKQIGQDLVGNNASKRTQWLELLKAVSECLPQDEFDKVPEKIADRNELHITSMECQFEPQIEAWFQCVKKHGWLPEEAAGQPAESDAAPPAPGGQNDAANPGAGGQGELTGPAGPGWIISLSGYHYHNMDRDPENRGAGYVRKTLLENLRSKTVTLPSDDGPGEKVVSMSQLGISYPMLVNPQVPYDYAIPDPNADLGATAPGMPRQPAHATRQERREKDDDRRGKGAPWVPGATGPAQPSMTGRNLAGMLTVKRMDFVVHFCWQPKALAAVQKQAEQKKAEAAVQRAAKAQEGSGAGERLQKERR